MARSSGVFFSLLLLFALLETTTGTAALALATLHLINLATKEVYRHEADAGILQDAQPHLRRGAKRIHIGKRREPEP